MKMSEIQERINAAVNVLVKFGARRVILFGSLIDHPERARDIDIAVDGIPLHSILAADAAIREVLELPVDLVSREENPEFFDIIKDYGKTLFEAA